MKYGSIIIENRDFDIRGIINRHRKFLPESWEIIHFNNPEIKTEMDYNALLTSPEFWHSLPFNIKESPRAYN